MKKFNIPSGKRDITEEEVIRHLQKVVADPVFTVSDILKRSKSFISATIAICFLFFAQMTKAASGSSGVMDTVPGLQNTGLHPIDTLKNKTVVSAADTTPPARSHLQLNLVYESNDVYLGRTDSTILPLLTPEISYIFKSGFEIDFSVGINVASPSPQINSYTLAVSYSFNPGNYSGEATLSGFKYSSNSGSPNAAQKGSLEYDNSYDLGFIEPSLSLTWTFATRPDYQVSFALAHEFVFSKNGNLNITPTATMNASTQNVYNSYYQNKRYSIPRPGKPPLPANVTISGEILNSDQFQIMDYEFSAPVNFVMGKWTFNFTPTEALPVNPPDIKLTTQVNNQIFYKTYKEVLPNVFYFQVGITYAF